MTLKTAKPLTKPDLKEFTAEDLLDLLAYDPNRHKSSTRREEVTTEIRRRLKELETLKAEELIAREVLWKRLEKYEAEMREAIHMLECGRVTGIALAAKKRLTEALAAGAALEDK